MIAVLIGKNVIYKTNLPENISGNYTINDKNGKKLINIQSRNGEYWQINSTNHAKIVNPEWLNKKSVKEEVINSVVLKEYNVNYILFSGSKEIFILYCVPTFEQYTHFDIINTAEITIGNNKDNEIFYNNPLIKPKQAKIFYSNGQLMLENYSIDYGAFINDKPALKQKRLLFNGDVIFIMGLKIIIIGRSIFINNPLNMVKLSDKRFVKNTKESILVNIKEEDDTDIEIYSQKDYFARAPRITNLIEREKIKIDAPPQIQSKEGMPLFIVLGSSLSMGAVTLISGYSTVERIISGEATLKQSMGSLLISLAMMVTMILIPILNVRYEKKQKIKYEKKRQKRYRHYLNTKIIQINEIMDKQREALYENYISAEECSQIILKNDSRLWERKIEDFDFLGLRLGVGDTQLDIDIEYQEKEFAMEDDDLIEILDRIAKEGKILENVPITISLKDKNVVGLVVKEDEKIREKFIQSLIMQLITFHSYEDLKLVFLLKEDRQRQWEHMKMLPHIWDNTKQIRFFAEDYQDMQEISQYLEQELNYRMMIQQRNDVNYKSFMPYYLIITDDYKKIENLNIIKQLLEQKSNMGYSILCITDNIMQLPNECKSFITLDNEEGKLFDSKISLKNQRKFSFDFSNTFFFEKISKVLSNIPIKEKMQDGSNTLPSNYTFLEMYDAGNIEQLNILERWKKNDATMSLQAPIGIDPSGMPIILDIHEKFHGPHGLIAGSTGSGKSEFIITYILSLAINYHPDDVSFILIDYKGGGLAGAFQKRDVKLPHLVGTITNIETAGLQRSLASIQSELRRRQVKFNEARNKTDEGTIDIYKYQRLYHDGIVTEPIPHLLIICDEFAELKQQQEEFMDELISVARIGRSLGVHLILATQKPAGIVNEQIRSNSKFGVCLKVQDTTDSTDVIKRPDAANLKRAGQFYLQVGNNEYFVLGQSAWSGAPYFPSDMTKKKIDNSIDIISNIGNIIKKIDDSKKELIKNKGEQLTNIVKYTAQLAKKEKIQVNQLWIDNIPETIYVDKIREKYSIKEEKNIINPVIGEYDDPNNQRQGPVRINFSKGGNVILYGNAESGKETALSTIIYDIMTNYDTKEAQMYIFDFGSEALKIFKNSPHVGEVIFVNDIEKISRFFEMIQKEIKERTAILSDYGGDYQLYVNSEGNVMPMIIAIFNNFEAFQENYEDKYEDMFLMITREGAKCGISFIITANNYSNVRYRLSQNFKQKIALQLNNQDDYLSIFDDVGKKRPSHIFGRGLIKLEDSYEFQTAKICDAQDWNKHIKQTITQLEQKFEIVAKPIPVLPDKVTLESVRNALESITTVPIGIDKESLEPYIYDFKRDFTYVITSKNIEKSIEFVSNIEKEIKKLSDVVITMFDAEKVLQTGKSNLNLNYKNFMLGIQNNLNKNKHTVCIIVGVSRFLNDIEGGAENFAEMLSKAKEKQGNSFILVESSTRLKNHQYDEWYKNYINEDTGIWVGNGIKDQYLMNITTNNAELINTCGESFGYVVKQGEATLIKLLGMKERDN